VVELLLPPKTSPNQGEELNQLVEVYLEMIAVEKIKIFMLLCPVKSSKTKRISDRETVTEELSMKTLKRIE